MSFPIKEKKHLPYLDGWRGLAIIMVLIAHFGGFIYNIGHLGVELFFVLSGLLMGKVLFIDQVNLFTFYRNRIARIFPVFYLYIIVVALMAWHYKYNMSPNDFFYSAIFLRTYYGNTSIWNKNIVPLSHTWSLNVEEHCYILLSVISLLALTRSEYFARQTISLCALACIAIFGLYKFFPPSSLSPFFLRTECSGFSIFISTGILLWLYHLRMHIPSFVPVITLAAALGIGAFAEHTSTKIIIPSLLLGIAVNTLKDAPRWMHAIFSNRLLVWLGTCSYSIYIWQQIFFYMIEYHDPSIRCMGLFMALIIGIFSFYFYERPMRYAIRNWRGTPYVNKPQTILVHAAR